MNHQEISCFQETQEDDIDSDHEELRHLSTAIPPQTTPEPPINVTYSNSVKRKSPSSFQESSDTLNPATTAVDHRLFGFKRLQLPHSFPAASPPPLRRTVSESIRPAETFNTATPFPTFPGFPISPGPALSPPPPASSKIGTAQESSPSLKGGPIQGLYRMVSDPSPFTNRQMVGPAATPPRPPTARKVSRSPSCEESPNSKRLKRMKERLREMNQWWNQVMSEGEEEEDQEDIVESENCWNEDKISQDECDLAEKGNGGSLSEGVWFEKKGDCLILNFKCPCHNINQLLLYGNKCYYKLTDF